MYTHTPSNTTECSEETAPGLTLDRKLYFAGHTDHVLKFKQSHTLLVARLKAPVYREVVTHVHFYYIFSLGMRRVVV